jgi:hypothetical protein
MRSMIQEVRFALRQLGQSPRFAAIGMVSPALGIGANLAIFGVVNSVLINPRPVPVAKPLALGFRTLPGFDRNPVSGGAIK